MESLSDDLLAGILGALDSVQLRAAAGTCRRWAALLRSRMELWQHVELHLPPRRSRGRDRRQSYTTPCGLDVNRIAAWLLQRRGAIASLDIALLYLDALGLLPQLLPPLDCLRRLVLRGQCSDWPYYEVDWRWLQSMAQLESLQLHDALPGMGELLVPAALTELRIDRVGEGEEFGGWDELPPCFSTLVNLQQLTLGTFTHFLMHPDDHAALAPLLAAQGLRELCLPKSLIGALPDVVTSLTALTLLGVAGCGGLGHFDELAGPLHLPDWSHAFMPLASPVPCRTLRCLDLSECELDALPPCLGGLAELRTLLLADNLLSRLVEPGADGSDSSAAALASLASQRQTASEQARLLPPRLQHLDLRGNPLLCLPELLCGPAAAQLTHLDLTCCYKLQPSPAEWKQLLRGLPGLHLLRHSCALLAAEVRGHGGAARFAAAIGACPQLLLEQWPPPRPARQHGEGTSAAHASRSCDSLEELELRAAAALLRGSSSSIDGWEWRSRSRSSSGPGSGRHATLDDLAASASSRGRGGEAGPGCG